jgi:hypothetical protein
MEIGSGESVKPAQWRKQTGRFHSVDAQFRFHPTAPSTETGFDLKGRETDRDHFTMRAFRKPTMRIQLSTPQSVLRDGAPKGFGSNDSALLTEKHRVSFQHLAIVSCQSA